MDDEFRALFSKILQLPTDQIHDELSPETAQSWDSLAMVDLIVGVEELFKITLSHEELMQFTSVGSLRGLLKTKGIAL